MTDDRSAPAEGMETLATAAAAAAASEDGRLPFDGARPAGETGAPAARSSIRDFGLRALVVLFILNAIDEFDRAVLAIALDRIRVDFGVSDATVGLLPLAVIFITGAISLPAGTWADRWTRRNILAIGAMIWGSAGMFAAASSTFIQLFLTRALLGFGQGTIAPTHLSLLSDYYPVQVRGRVLGYHRAANPAGQVIGALVGGGIVAAAGWRWGFVAAALPGLLFGLYALTLREPRRGESDLLDAAAENPLLAEFLHEPDDKPGFFASLGDIFANRTLRLLILTNAAFGFTLFGIVFWLPAFFEREYGFTTSQAGVAFAFLALAAFAGTWFGGPLADRNVHKGFTYIAKLGVYATGFLTLTWTVAFAAPSAPVTIIALVLGAVITSLAIPGVTAIVAAVSPPRIRSQAFAAFGLALAVCGAAAAPLVVGAASEALQQWAGMDEGASLRWSMVASAATVASLGTYLMYRASKVAAEDVQRTMAAFLQDYMSRAQAKAAAASDGSGA